MTKTKTKTDQIMKEIKSRKGAVARRGVEINAPLLYGYLHDPDVIKRTTEHYEDWLESLNSAPLIFLNSGKLITSTDQQGSIVVSQPSAERLVLRASRRLGPAFALIMMIETCYGPQADSSGLQDVLEHHYGLVAYPGLVDTACLHRFLEVDMDIKEWADDFREPKKERDPFDFVRAVTAGPGFNALDFMSIQEALVAIYKTDTLRARKVNACLHDPAPRSDHLEKCDPDFLKLLFTRQSRGAQ